ncbi:MAG: hypothetical protein KDA80_08200 [Planctomycetaceae bacterium]|nr:hypothetical protein [Planctomycetaceae bacterium]
MTGLQIFNACEGILWIALALIFGCGRITGLRPPLRIQFAVSLLLFSLSEWIEIQTGAWWRPWWLAFLKGTCIVFITDALRRLFRNRRLGRVHFYQASDRSRTESPLP